MGGCPSCGPPPRVRPDMPKWMAPSEPSALSVVITAILLFLAVIALRLALALAGWWRF